MFKLLSTGFWDLVARFILRNKILILLAIITATVLLSTQWKNINMSYTEANLLPDHHEANLIYDHFLEVFGEEGNLVVIGIKDSSLFTVSHFKAWDKLSKQLKSHSEVDLVVSISDLQKLVKDESKQTFDLEPFINDSIQSQEQLDTFKKELFEESPFYDGFLFNRLTGTVRTAVYLKKDIVNTSARKNFIFNKLIKDIEHKSSHLWNALHKNPKCTKYS